MKNDAYVYQHVDSLTNEIFYVGMSTNNKDGKYNRQYNKNRNSKWKDFTKDKSYKVEIIKENLSAGEAVDLEAELIEKYKRGGKLTNIRDINNIEEDFFYNFKAGTNYMFTLKSPKTMDLLTILCMLCQYNRNSLTLTKEIKGLIKFTISLNDSQLCKHLKILKDTGGITKENNLVTINNKYFWKGDLEKLERITNL